MKKRFFILALLAVGLYSGIESGFIHSNAAALPVSAADHQLSAAYNNHQSDIQVQGTGKVIRILSDDNDGSRHQRFIIRLGSGQTLLVAHNIDLASRIVSLKTGDAIEFNGEYEWNAKGGVIHWTHHDPQGSHPAGWIKHNGHTYQ